MRFLLFSDLHLDARTAGLARFHDVSGSLDEIVSLSHEQEFERAIFAGDLADPGAQAHRCTARAVEVAKALKCPSDWLTGNHDVVEDGTGASTLSAVQAAGFNVVDGPLLDTGRQVLYLPFTPRSKAYDPAVFIEEMAAAGAHPSLIVGHLNLEGITAGSETNDMPRGRDVFWPLEAIARCFPDAVLAAGHYHTAQEFRRVHIIGSAQVLAFGPEEAHEPRALSIEFKGKRKPKIESIKIRQVRKVYSAPASDLDRVESGDLVRVLIDDKASELLEADAVQAIEGVAAGFVTVRGKHEASPPAAAGVEFEETARRIAAAWKVASAELSAALCKMVGETIDEVKSDV